MGAAAGTAAPERLSRSFFVVVVASGSLRCFLRLCELLCFFFLEEEDDPGALVSEDSVLLAFCFFVFLLFFLPFSFSSCFVFFGPRFPCAVRCAARSSFPSRSSVSPIKNWRRNIELLLHIYYYIIRECDYSAFRSAG